MTTPVTRYAKSDDVHVAYQEFGAGPVNIVFVPGFVGGFKRWSRRVGRIVRLEYPIRTFFVVFR